MEVSFKEKIAAATMMVADKSLVPEGVAFGGYERRTGRGRPGGAKPINSAGGFNDMHHEICRMVALGYKPSEIQAALGVSNPTVTKVRNSEIGRSLIRTLRVGRDLSVTDVSQGIRDLEPVALGVLEDALTQEDVPWSTKANVALKLISELGGHAAPKKIQVAHAILTPDMIDEIKKDAVKAGINVHQGGYLPDSIEDVPTLKKELEVNDFDFSFLTETEGELEDEETFGLD